MSAVDIQALRNALAAMTPGTWVADSEEDDRDCRQAYILVDRQWPPLIRGEVRQYQGTSYMLEDGNFRGICLLRNTASSLVEEVERLRALVSDATEQCESYARAYTARIAECGHSQFDAHSADIWSEKLKTVERVLSTLRASAALRSASDGGQRE